MQKEKRKKGNKNNIGAPVRKPAANAISEKEKKKMENRGAGALQPAWRAGWLAGISDNYYTTSWLAGWLAGWLAQKAKGKQGKKEKRKHKEKRKRRANDGF